MDAFGLIGGTGYGLQALRALLEELERGGSARWSVPRTIEVVDDELVLAVGVISERGQVGGRFASAVAWLFRVREGRILAVFGYPTEAAARRRAEGLELGLDQPPLGRLGCTPPWRTRPRSSSCTAPGTAPGAGSTWPGRCASAASTSRAVDLAQPRAATRRPLRRRRGGAARDRGGGRAGGGGGALLRRGPDHGGRPPAPPTSPTSSTSRRSCWTRASRCSPPWGAWRPDWWIVADDGRTVTIEPPEAIFYNACPPELAGRRRRAARAAVDPVLRAAGPGGGVEGRPDHLRDLRAGRRDPGLRPGADVPAGRRRAPPRRRPLAVPDGGRTRWSR